jgi:hypothetical protein
MHRISAYQGIALIMPKRPPTKDELIGNPEAVRHFAGFLVANQADRVAFQTQSDLTVLDMHFRH